MSRRRPWVAGVLAVALTLTLGGCTGESRGTMADLTASRDAVRIAAETDLPALAEALGGTITAARGEYGGGGDGIVNRQRYTTRVVIEGSRSTGDEIAAAVEALGYEVVQQADADTGVAAERGELTLSTSTGPSPLVVGIDGPYLTLPDEDRPPVGWEDLDLPGIDVPQLEGILGEGGTDLDLP